MPTANEFRAELHAWLASAEAAGKRFVEISAGELHRKVGGANRMPNCCSVMRQEQRDGDEVISEKKSDHTGFTVRYQLPRPRPAV